MRAWREPEYESIDASARQQFTELVKTQTLFAYVEECKRDLVRVGADVPDRWLTVICAGSVTESEGLPQHERDRLGALITEIYAMLVRLDPEAQPHEQAVTGRAVVDDTESALPAFTQNELAVLRTLGGLNGSELATAARIEAAMELGERVSKRSIGVILQRLIKLGLAERPEGERDGIRLTLAGRKLLRKIAF